VKKSLPKNQQILKSTKTLFWNVLSLFQIHME